MSHHIADNVTCMAVSDIGPHMKVAEIHIWKDQSPCNLCCSHCYEKKLIWVSSEKYLGHFCLLCERSLRLKVKLKACLLQNNSPSLRNLRCNDWLQQCRYKQIPYRRHFSTFCTSDELKISCISIIVIQIQLQLKGTYT